MTKKKMTKKETKKEALKSTVKDIEVSAEEAKAALQREVDGRITACTQEIQAVLQRYRCDIHVALTLNPPNQMIPNIRVVALQ